jgi:hypothetical protein
MSAIVCCVACDPDVFRMIYGGITPKIWQIRSRDTRSSRPNPASSDTGAVGGATRCHFVMKRCAEVEGSKPDTESEGAHEARDKHMVGMVGHGQRQHH